MPPSRFRLSPKARQSLAKIHRWVGIFVGLNAALLCLTGAILVYGEDIDTYLNPHLRSAVASGPMISPAAAIDVYKRARPGVAVDRIYAPAPPLETYRLRTGPKSEQLEAFVDPYKGVFLGERVREDVLVRKLANFHIALLGIPFGRTINGFTALAGLWLLTSGIFIWWPATKRQIKARISVKKNATPRRRAIDLHNVAGIYTAPILIAVFFTGFIWSFEELGDSMFGLIGSRPRFTPPPKAAPTGAPYLSNEAILALSEKQAPTSHLVKFMTPTSKNKIAEVHREWADGDRYGNKLLTFVDAETGKVIAQDDSRADNPMTSFYRLLRPFHRGLWAGNVSRALWAVAALAPITLLITGLLKLRHRRRANRELALRRAVVQVLDVPEEALEAEKEPALTR